MAKYILSIVFLGYLNLNAQKNNTNQLIIGNPSNLQLFASNNQLNNLSNSRVNVIQANSNKQINKIYKPDQTILTKKNQRLIITN